MSELQANLPVLFRKMNSEDESFIYHSWLKSFRNSTFASKISNTVYFNDHHKVVEKLIKNSNVIIACPEDDTSNVIGYICASTLDGILCIHYIYVKQSFRSLGIANMLLHTFNYNKDIASIYTHHTRPMDSLQYKYNMMHQPYVAFSDIYIQSQKTKDLIEAGINKGRLAKRSPGRPKKSNPLKESISTEPSNED